MPLTKHRFVGSHPVDIDTGRVLEPGETVSLDKDDPHNKALIDDGVLVAVKPDKESK